MYNEGETLMSSFCQIFAKWTLNVILSAAKDVSTRIRATRAMRRVFLRCN